MLGDFSARAQKRFHDGEDMVGRWAFDTENDRLGHQSEEVAANRERLLDLAGARKLILMNTFVPEETGKTGDIQRG